MGTASAEDLARADSQLSRSFVACVAVWIIRFLWNLFATPTDPETPQTVPWGLLLILVPQIGTYVWYAVAAGNAARVLGAVGWWYVAWILVAPFLALLPIPVVSLIIAASPLSIKFLLGGQLQTAMREATFEDMHHPS